MCDEAEDRDYELLDSAALQSMIEKKERDIALLRKLRATKARLGPCDVAAEEQDPVQDGPPLAITKEMQLMLTFEVRLLTSE